MSTHLRSAAFFLVVTACGARPSARPAGAGPATPTPASPRAADLIATSGATWRPLPTVPYKGKQDDVVFVSPDRGWYGNGAGFLYRTDDGGATWVEKRHQPGTYFRALGFVDADHGFAGNLGPDYFPGVTDATPLYGTTDGGETWAPVATTPPIKGICAIDVLHAKYINAGVLADRVTIRAAGRVGGPAMMATSRDGGRTFTTEDLSAQAGMILDVHFVDERTGFLCAASDANVEVSHARILKTTDGGGSWRTVYESTRPFELTWKCAFPTADVGYATVQSYDERPEASRRYVAKTTDRGEHWTEVLLVDDASVTTYGIAFADAETGWVGARDGGFQTTDGGKTWTKVDLGQAVNKIRVVPAEGGFVAYAIGSGVYKLDARPAR